jgi:RHS repeat-associated protein
MVAQAFSKSLSESSQSNALKGARVELLIDNKVVASTTTPATFPNHSYTVDFGKKILGGLCSLCLSGLCTPGKFEAVLQDDCLANISLGRAGPDGGLMELVLNPTSLVSEAAKEGSFQYYGMQTGPVNLIGTAGSGHRQILSPNGLTDIADTTDGSGNYTGTNIKVYQGSGTQSGGYYTGQTLTKTIRFEHSYDAGTGSAGTDTLTATETDSNGTKTTTYTYDRAAKKRTLVTNAGKRKESLTTVTGSGTRTVTKEVRAADDTLLQKLVQTYTTYAWGEELTSEVNDPAGAARTKTWTFETTSGANGYGKVTSMTDSDGYWERYTYYADGRREKVISQYNGAAAGSSEANSRVVTTTYSGDNRTEVETLLGQEVARRYIVRSTSGAVTTQREEVCTVPGAAAGAATNLVTTTVYRTDGSDVTRPDGTLVKTTIAATSGGGQTTTLVTGGASGGTVTNGTQQVVQQDARGNEFERTVTDVASGTMLLHDIATLVDAYGRPKTITHLNGTTESKTYGCCGLDSWTDVEGITTTYGHDEFGNVSSESRAGITLTRTYDALGRLRLLTRSGTDNMPITMGGSDYNLVGRETLRHTILGDIGVAQVHNGDGSWTRTETLPGNATRIRQWTSDGLLLGLSGTAQHPRSYGYEVAGGVRSVKETRIGENGATTEWVKQSTDAAGRLTKETTADSAHTDYSYNAKGQLASRTDADGAVTLYGYNTRGEQTTTTLDLNRNGVIDAGEPSTTTDHSVLSGKLRTTTTTTSDTGTITVAAIDQDLTDLNRTETRYGLTTSVNVTMGAGARTETSTFPDQSTYVRTYSNGRLASEVLSHGSDVARSWSYHYDARARLDTATDARTGATTYTYYDTDLVHTVARSGRTTSYDYNALGQRTGESLPGGRTITRDYKPTGELISVTGNAEYPVTYGYDPQGRMTGMTTATGTTTWIYDPQRGWLSTKKDAAQRAVGYTYTAAGRPGTRTWARGVTTTYGYDNGGRLHTITYSDDTPAVILGYDARNQINSVLDAAGTHTLGYAVTGDLQSDAVSAGLLNGVTATNSFDTKLRKSGFAVTRSSSTLASYGWGYDGLSRLQTVTSGTNTATYAYHPNSALVHTITFAQGGTTGLTTTKEFDEFDRLSSNVSVPTASDTVGVTFHYNDAGDRDTATLPDGTFWSYGSNTRGEVISGTKKLADSTALSGYQFGYTFDDIGNRLTATRGARTASYSPNALDQYTSRTVPGYLNVLGKADASATVTVNGAATTRQGDGYFHAELPVSNGAGPSYTSITVSGVSGSNQAQLSGHLFLPATPESYQYDLDGNLLSDGRWNYTWDAENRLASMVTKVDAADAGAPRQRITFGYDYAGRRISKKVEDWVTDHFAERFTLLFTYDGWNPAAEWVQGGGGIPLRSYAWGSDLSGGSAAGGVGGLLFLNQLPESKSFAVAYDGNGNVASLTDMADGSNAATYEYGPFGELLRSTGLFARINPIRWSTKYQDNESDFVYYGYRYYNPDLGRWLSRDPIGEAGGVNLYGFVGNASTGRVDKWGLSTRMTLWGAVFDDSDPNPSYLASRQQTASMWQVSDAFVKESQRTPDEETVYQNSIEYKIPEFFDASKQLLVAGALYGTGIQPFFETTAEVDLTASILSGRWEYGDRLSGATSLALIALTAPFGVAFDEAGGLVRAGTGVTELRCLRAAKTLPGPALPTRIADTFADSAYVNRQLAEDTSFFKYHGLDNRTGRKFSWVTDQKYASEAELRSALAIREDWGVDITHVSEFNVPKGTWISEGLAAPQGIGYPGGAYQGVLQNVPRSWIIRTDPAFP